MSLAEKLSLGLSTALTGMGIVFIVLIALWIIIVLEHKFFDFTGIGTKPHGGAAVAERAIAAPLIKSGTVRGRSELTGVEDDEIAAVILAAVSEETDIPIGEIDIKSIKKLD